jgi:hypothetical protein
VMGVGCAAAVGALVLDPARAAVGPLPPDATALLPQARFVMGLDVRRFADSAFYRRYAAPGSATRPQPFKDLEERTGLNPERDLDQIFVAGGSDPRQGGALLALGRFDRDKLGRAMVSGKKATTTKSVQGTTVYLFDEGADKASALAFLDDHSLVLGRRSIVEAAIASRSGAQQPQPEAVIVDLLGRVKPGSTFWMVGDQSLLANIPRGLPASGSPAAPSGSPSPVLTLPALKSLVVSGDLEPEVTLSITGDAADAAAAKNLADIVRGFIALASLQAGQKPELQQLASAVSVTTEASQVHVAARVPYELLDALGPKRSPIPSPAH